ncbi:MAG: hypothetical protein QOI11_953 [Candidatus Eremiobacteraeota bacterium]|nr:hypothetical protein [Candidatus Eremiobacteraeota bacterium]
MLRLGPRSRGALAAAGLTAFALAYVTTPLAAGSDSPPPVADPLPVRAVTPPPAPAIAVALVPRRDPFAGVPQAHGRAAPSAPPATAPIPTLPPLPPLPPIPGVIGLLPSNAGAALGPPPSGGVRVTALTTGAHASALVEDRSGTRIVKAGDILAGGRITAIDAAGVHVGHGTTYPVAPAGQLLSPQLIPPGGLP